MTRFSPDSDILDSMIHAVYRYKTGEIDDDGNPIYRPIAFQNDAEDVSLKYDDFELTTFDVSDPIASKEAFANTVRNFDNNVMDDIRTGKMDLFQLLQRITDICHVTSKMAVNTYDVPTKLSQLTNDAGYVKSTDPINRAHVSDTADKLTTPVNISITGKVNGTATAFDGSQNVAIDVTSVRADKDGSGNDISTTYVKRVDMPDTLINQEIVSGVDETGKLVSAKTLNTYVRSVASGIDTGVMSVVTGSTNGCIGVDGVNVPVKGLGSAAYTQSTEYSKTGHTHPSSEIVKLTQYVKPNQTSAISQDDTLNVALGKLEKALDFKENSLSVIGYNELSEGEVTIERTITAKVLSDWLLSRVPKSIGANNKFVYTDNNGVLTSADFEIWVTD